MQTVNKGLVIITGASSGIGAACADKFASQGWNLLLTARRLDRLKLMAVQLEKQYKIDVFPLELDVREPSSGALLVNYLHRNGLQADVLLNNAGLAAGLSPIHEGLADDWERMIDTNIKGLLYISRSIAPLMVARKFGHIINIGSIAGKEAYAGGNVYCATKFAVDGLTKAMRIDLVGHGVKVTQIAPGAVETEFSLVRFKGDEDRAEKVYDGYQPLSAADVADAVYYCASLPAHVNVNDMVLMPTAQAAATVIDRKSNQ
jgi:NADP-dependent 3-hydroxy acid dehydrogenase YdfG